MLYNGQPGAFALRLEADYGKGTVERLEGKKREITKNVPYEGKIKEYTELLALITLER